ncbi:DNA gyrase/topoisomerase IV subunit A [bacterium]|nr:DNA gyrase/topoisomerase IV subunit A [bacterium]
MARKKKSDPPPPPPPTLVPDAVEVGETYRDYFLQYASYVITDRAIPDVADGLKPVQRRILHSLWENEDGRYNKVANIVGHAMKYHPHGDASIFAALVGLGQKELLIDTQGNWGDPVTGDAPAAARYIEARLTKFALEVGFHPDLTTYKLSYDGRNKEPVALPVRFPLLLALGTEGIAVGLTTRILPHNFVELLEAQKKYFRKEPFEIFPDFPTGGLADVSGYNDGAPGSRVKVRARLEDRGGKAIAIREIAYGTTTEGVIESIVNAGDKGKIKLARIDDNTAGEVDILVYFQRGVDMDKAMDALYAFTDCEVTLSPNGMVIRDGRPVSMTTSELLIHNADQTRELLRRDLELQRDALETKWHHKSLVQFFVENRIYLRIEKSKTWEAVLSEIDEGLKPHRQKLRREVTHDDLVMLTEVRIRRISAWDAERAREELDAIDRELAEINKHLRNLTKYVVAWLDHLIEKYGKGRERKTELTQFEAVRAVEVAARTEKLYVDREHGFVGTDPKIGEEIGPCSRLDNVLTINRDGSLKVTKVEARSFVGEKILWAQVFDAADRDRVFNIVYDDGRTEKGYVKRFAIGGVTRDKDYPLIPKSKGGRVYYLSDGDEKFALVKLRKKPRIRTEIPVRFDDFLVKGRVAGGVTISKHKISSVQEISRNKYAELEGLDANALPAPAGAGTEEDEA